MQLETYISDLLYRYECVTVPEFGAFLTQRESAKIHESTNAFYPPKKVLSFNEQIQKNDGLLAHYIADIEKIPFEVASKKIQDRVDLLKLRLTNSETLSLKNIGELSLNNEGKITFEPSLHLNYLTDAFGLSQIVSPAVTREDYKEEAKVVAPVKATKKVPPFSTTLKTRKNRPYLKYAAIALVALTLGGFAASNFYTSKIETHNLLAQEEAHTQLDNKIQKATFVIDNPLPPVTLTVDKIKVPTGKYHIIAGAFRVEENCNKKIEELKALGYNARKIGVNKHGLHQVVYSSYEDRLESLKALRAVKNTHDKNAWLLVKDLN